MKREDGFYWVKLLDRWEAARYVSEYVCEYWEVIGSNSDFYDEDFDQIGEQIKKPED